MKKRGMAVIGMLAVFAASAAGAGRQEPSQSMPGVTNYTRVDVTTGCGGSTTTEAYPALKRAGYVSVINLRLADEPGVNIEEAKAAAAAAGLKYIHVPINGHAPTAAAADAFLAAVRDPTNAPLFIHCASANRVGAVWLIKRVLVDKWDVPRATAEAERIGLRSPQLRQFALEYIDAHKD